MPILQFKGKSFVQNHHLAVPYHQLVPQKDKSLTDKVSLHDNLVVQGDNLLALKALLPTYAGKVDCIYIDPPYNTGNEGWLYNDKVTSPLMKSWIGQVVGKEGEDLTRHDKWLCMMMPRLKLLKELLADDGVIFISNDDIEHHLLRVLMDEVFGYENFVDNIIWKKRYGGGSKEKHLVSLHEYVLVYAKNIESISNIDAPLKDASVARYYKMTDSKEAVRGAFRTHPLEATKSMDSRPNLVYAIPAPDGSEIMPKRQWLWSKERALKALENDELYFIKDKNNGYTVHTKQYLMDEDGIKRTAKYFSIIDDVYTQHGTNEFIELFGDAGLFPFPKPSKFVKQLLEIATGFKKNAIILDSFAGSGTTAQAVLDLNKEDGGNRKFILVECEDYVDSITAERVRRVIKGVPNASNAILKAGLGGTFSYFELGDPIETEGILNGSKLPSYLELARYVYYTATGEEFDESKLDESNNFVGASSHYDVYMLYKPDIEYLKQTALTLNQARELREKAGNRQLLVFAPTKYVESGELDELKIDFCQLPFEIYKVAK